MAKAKKARADRKKKVKDLAAKAVGADKARTIAGGKATFNDFVITHTYDKSSPVLG